MTDSTEQYLQQRISRRQVVEGMGECWEWQLSPSSTGYATCKLPGESRALVHRVVYERYRGAVPKGCQVDHLCFNRICVNPDHLEAVTPSQNIRRQKLRKVGRPYAIYQRRATGLWYATCELNEGGRRRKKEFTSMDRGEAVRKAEEFLAKMPATNHTVHTQEER